MKKTEQTDFSDFSMLDLFRMEVVTQLEILNKGLLDLERNYFSPELLSPLMRAAHSIKGAARMVSVDSVVRIAHVIEDCLVALQAGDAHFSKNHVDSLLNGIDLIYQIATSNDEKIIRWGADHYEELRAMESSLKAVYTSGSSLNVDSPELNLDKELERVENKILPTDDEASQLHTAPHTTTAIRVSIDRLR